MTKIKYTVVLLLIIILAWFLLKVYKQSENYILTNFNQMSVKSIAVIVSKKRKYEKENILYSVLRQSNISMEKKVEFLIELTKNNGYFFNLHLLFSVEYFHEMSDAEVLEVLSAIEIAFNRWPKDIKTQEFLNGVKIRVKEKRRRK